MKIVFMGTPELAATVLAALCGEHEVICAVTNPDRPKGRKKTPLPSAVKAKAEELGIPVHTCARLRDPAETEFICGLDADMIVVAAFGQIVPPQVLACPRFGCVNVHTSLLPAYRGAAPIQWAILDGCEKTGVTIMQMDEGLDTGEILAQSELAVSPQDTALTLTEKLAEEGGRLLLATIRLIEEGRAVRIPQPAESTTAYAGMIRKEMGTIRWDESAELIDRKIRAFTPWPGTATSYEGPPLKIFSAYADAEHGGVVPGTAHIQGNELFIAAGDRWMRIGEVQLAGKKRMSAADFLRGCRVSDGTVLGQPG